MPLADSEEMESWSPRSLPPRTVLRGKHCWLEPLNVARHGADLVKAYRNTDLSSWRYLFVGPFDSDAQCEKWLADAAARQHEIFYALVEGKAGKAVGMMAYMRMDAGNGVIEVGNIHYADSHKRSCEVTEAMFLMMCHIFDDLEYRRYEWKCDSLNASSRRAALRLGFQFEGIFRQHMVVKGLNRDTAWFAMTDKDWPTLKRAYEKWLAPSNSDANGSQLASLADLIGAERRSE